MSEHSLNPVIPIVATKLNIPGNNEQYISRPHLLDKLEGQDGCRLVLLSAPAGFGKTSLISEWLHAKKLKTAWLSLDSTDDDPMRFLNYLVESVARIEPSLKGAVSEMPTPIIQTNVAPTLALLVNHLVKISGEACIVLDDYHEISEQEIHKSLSFLIDHIPPQLKVVMLTRSDPSLPLARYRAKGWLTELRVSNLLFSLSELGEFLSGKMQIPLSEQQLKSLHERTEGWVAGVHMAALSMRNSENIPKFIEEFTGDNRYIFDFLLEEIFNRQTPEIQSFLLQTSVLDRLCGSLCDAVTGQSNSQQILIELETANLFLFPLDQTRTWFRYHHLFADLLKVRFKAEKPESVNAVYNKACQWFKENGFIEEAIEITLKTQDWKNAVDLIKQAQSAVENKGQHLTFQRWLQKLPEHIRDTDPSLCLNYAQALVTMGKFDLARNVIERCLDTGENKGTDEQKAHALVILGRINHRTGNLVSAVDYYNRSLELIDTKKDREMYYHSIFGLAGALVTIGDIRQARNRLPEDILFDVPNHFRGFSYRSLLATVTHNSGDVSGAKARYSAIVAETASLPYMRIVYSYVGLAIIDYEFNELSEAEKYARDAIKIAHETGRHLFLSNAHLILAQILKATGQADEAITELKKGQEIAEAQGRKPVLFLINNLQIFWQLAEGNFAMVSAWAEEKKLDITDEVDYQNEPMYLNFARLLVAKGETVSAEQLLLKMAKSALDVDRFTSYIIIETLRALALEAGGNSEQSLSILADVLILPESQNYIRTFVDEGEKVAVLLSRLGKKTNESLPQLEKISAAYLQKLLNAFPKTAQSSTAKQVALPENVPASYALDPLSERELEVLNHIAAGLSNQEIADKMYVAKSTIKTHINKIYSKLDVNSRTQALARGKDWALLDDP